MSDPEHKDKNPSGLPPRRAGEDGDGAAPAGAAMPSTGGGAAVPPADEDDAPETGEDGARLDAAPITDAELPVSTVASADLPLATRHHPDPAPTAGAGMAVPPALRTGPVPDHAGLDRGLANLYGFDGGERPVWVLWVMGGAAVLAGVLALFMPLVATLAATTLAAAMLLLSGTVGLFAAFRREGGGAIAAGIAISVLSVIGGLLMLFMPLAGILAISTLILAYLAFSGGMKLWYALRAGGEAMPGRGWMIASGALSLLLAAVLWFQLPEAALWLPGLFLAVDLLMYGAMMLALAWHLSRQRRAFA